MDMLKLNNFVCVQCDYSKRRKNALEMNNMTDFGILVFGQKFIKIMCRMPCGLRLEYNSNANS